MPRVAHNYFGPRGVCYKLLNFDILYLSISISQIDFEVSPPA